MGEERSVSKGVGKSREFIHALLGRNTDGEALNVDSVQVREMATALR
jgi:hypothetical protein